MKLKPEAARKLLKDETARREKIKAAEVLAQFKAHKKR